MEGEAHVLHIGIRWLTDLGFQHAILETGSKALVDRLNSSIIDHTELGDLILACKNLLSLNPHFKVQFARRQANRAAHTLARVAATSACSHIFSFIPDCIASVIINEIS